MNGPKQPLIARAPSRLSMTHEDRAKKEKNSVTPFDKNHDRVTFAMIVWSSDVTIGNAKRNLNHG